MCRSMNCGGAIRVHVECVNVIACVNIGQNKVI